MNPDDIKRFQQAFSYRVMNYSISPLVLSDPFDDKIIEHAHPDDEYQARIEMIHLLTKVMY
jgi:hypothetical protein